MVDWDDEAKLPISIQADLLSLNRSSLYYKPVGPSPEELFIKHRIDEIYTKHPYYGSRRIAALLNAEGLVINRKAVQRHMREMGIAGITPGPNLSKRSLEHRIYPYLLRNLKITHPNHVWGIDITYIRLQKSWMYLVALIDWYSRYVVSWEIDQTLEIDFVLEAVKRAFLVARPEILNSDQGSHFTSPKYTDLVLENTIKISMDGKKRALDNIIVYCKIKVQRCAKFLCKWLCRGALHGGVAMITCLGLPNLLQLAAWQKNHGCRGSMSSP